MPVPGASKISGNRARVGAETTRGKRRTAGKRRKMRPARFTTSMRPSTSRPVPVPESAASGRGAAHGIATSPETSARPTTAGVADQREAIAPTSTPVASTRALIVRVLSAANVASRTPPNPVART